MRTTNDFETPYLPTFHSRLIKAVHRVDLRVGNIDQALSFYRDVVGLSVDSNDDTSASLSNGDGRTLLHLDSSGVTAPAVRNSTGLYHTAIRFPSRADLGDALARLVHGGYRVGAGDHGFSEALYIDDPDGNGVELYRDRPVEEWPEPQAGQKIVGMAAPVDLNDLIRTGRQLDAVDQKAPVGTDIGHVHLKVSDLSRTLEFYGSLLGLDVMGELFGSAAFFSSMGYHHHIGTNTWESRGLSAASPQHAGLSRVTFSATDQVELDALAQRLSGEHRVEDNDGALVVRDPDGTELAFLLAN